MMQLTMDKLDLMKLYGMSDGLKEQMASSAYKDLSFEERFGMLVDKEMVCRDNRKLQMLLRKAHLRYPNACIEDINFRVKRGIIKQVILKLAQNEWIRNKQNIIIIGSTGVGKSYIACTFGNNACRAGISTYYVRLPRLLKDFEIARADGRYIKLLQRLSRVKLLIVDDWGLSSLSDVERRDFLEITEDRHNVRSTIICGQLPIDKWHDVIGDPTIADAICDRLIHNAHKINLKGESMRKILSNIKTS